MCVLSRHFVVVLQKCVSQEQLHRALGFGETGESGGAGGVDKEDQQALGAFFEAADADIGAIEEEYKSLTRERADA